jgi:hypothetical protein
MGAARRRGSADCRTRRQRSCRPRGLPARLPTRNGLTREKSGEEWRRPQDAIRPRLPADPGPPCAAARECHRGPSCAAGGWIPVRDSGRTALSAWSTRSARANPTACGWVYICRSIVEAQGGHLWAATTAGTGATLAFARPVSAPPRAQARCAGRPRSRSPAGLRRRIEPSPAIPEKQAGRPGSRSHREIAGRYQALDALGHA